MSNYRKSKIFGKKEKFNLFVFVGITLFIIFIMYLTSTPSKADKSQNEFGKSEISQNSTGFEQELNVNENIIDNAVQVKDDNVLDKQEIDINKEKSDELNNKNELATNDSSNNDLAQLNNESVENSTEKNIAMETNEESAQVSTSGNISFVSPVEGAVIREYTNDTIYSKTLNTWRTREGIDFKAEIGSPVVSVLDGVVEKIDNDLTERGEYIVIKHEDGFKTMYTNLDEEVKVVIGQKIRKGEVIATVGNSSGNYSNEDYGAHLNFVMYLNNEEVNPSEYINFK